MRAKKLLTKCVIETVYISYEVLLNSACLLFEQIHPADMVDNKLIWYNFPIKEITYNECIWLRILNQVR